MPDRKPLPGKFVWFELVTKDAPRAQAFYGEVFGWKVVPFPMGAGSYDMIYAGDTMIGGHSPASAGPSHWLSYVSVADVDAAAREVSARGGQVIAPPSDIPTVGRFARVTDPQGGELCLFKSSTGDPADEQRTPPGRWVWNELHTPDPAGALAFYAAVLGYSHVSMEMGPGGAYHIVSRDGVPRGGVTSHLPPGAPAHWLPYVHVEDPDATMARAGKLGGKLCFGPEDVGDVGRIGGFEDPTGAAIAIIKPQPPQDKPR